SSYYTFFLMERFGSGTQAAHVTLLLCRAGMSGGVMLGDIVGDRGGRGRVMWLSILGVLLFILLLLDVAVAVTGVTRVVIGVVLASAFRAIVVFAQELVPGRTGMIAGIFFGFSFGMGGIAAAFLGWVADMRGIEYVYWLCSFLPLMGLLTIFLPKMNRL